MKRMLIFLSLCLFVIACKNRHNDTVNFGSTNDVDSIFVSKNLQDSVISFINSIDSFPGMKGFPVEYLLRCEIDSNKDTIIELHAAIEFTPTDLLLEPERLVGGALVCNKPLMVRYKYLSELEEVINEKQLDTLFGKQIDSLMFFKELDSLGYEGPRRTTCKIYKYCGSDSLKLLHNKYLGKIIE